MINYDIIETYDVKLGASIFKVYESEHIKSGVIFNKEMYIAKFLKFEDAKKFTLKNGNLRWVKRLNDFGHYKIKRWNE